MLLRHRARCVPAVLSLDYVLSAAEGTHLKHAVKSSASSYLLLPRYLALCLVQRVQVDEERGGSVI